MLNRWCAKLNPRSSIDDRTQRMKQRTVGIAIDTAFHIVRTPESATVIIKKILKTIPVNGGGNKRKTITENESFPFRMGDAILVSLAHGAEMIWLPFKHHFNWGYTSSKDGYIFLLCWRWKMQFGEELDWNCVFLFMQEMYKSHSHFIKCTKSEGTVMLLN